jgi:hypothetical protein
MIVGIALAREVVPGPGEAKTRVGSVDTTGNKLAAPTDNHVAVPRGQDINALEPAVGRRYGVRWDMDADVTCERLNRKRMRDSCSVLKATTTSRPESWSPATGPSQGTRGVAVCER